MSTKLENLGKLRHEMKGRSYEESQMQLIRAAHDVYIFIFHFIFLQNIKKIYNRED